MPVDENALHHSLIEPCPVCARYEKVVRAALRIQQTAVDWECYECGFGGSDEARGLMAALAGYEKEESGEQGRD